MNGYCEAAPVSADQFGPLGELKHHWGSAYKLHYFAAIGLWVAQRRDTGETLKADSPAGLRVKIIADYTARPVPR